MSHKNVVRQALIVCYERYSMWLKATQPCIVFEEWHVGLVKEMQVWSWKYALGNQIKHELIELFSLSCRLLRWPTRANMPQWPKTCQEEHTAASETVFQKHIYENVKQIH